MNREAVARELVKLAKELVAAPKLPKAVKRWYDIFKKEGKWDDKKCIKEAIQRAFEEDEITEDEAEKLEKKHRVAAKKGIRDSLLDAQEILYMHRSAERNRNGYVEVPVKDLFDVVDAMRDATRKTDSIKKATDTIVTWAKAFKIEGKAFKIPNNAIDKMISEVGHALERA